MRSGSKRRSVGARRAPARRAATAGWGADCLARTDAVFVAKGLVHPLLPRVNLRRLTLEDMEGLAILARNVRRHRPCPLGATEADRERKVALCLWEIPHRGELAFGVFRPPSILLAVVSLPSTQSVSS